MLATSLRELAEKENACNDGLLWLTEWIEKHPKGTASEFFRWAEKNVPGPSPSGRLSDNRLGYPEWCLRELLDWSEFGDYSEAYATLLRWGLIAPLCMWVAQSAKEERDMYKKQCRALAQAFE